MDTLPLVSPEQVGLSAARLARISQWMKGWVDSGKLPGLLVAVMRKGELAFAETYGKADVERNKPVRPDTIYRIYSMTKPLTSTAIMMLYEEGRFQLDDPISKFIPGFANPRVYSGGSRGKIDFPATARANRIQCLMAKHIPVQKVGLNELLLGPQPASPHVVFDATEGAAQGVQISGLREQQGAEVIGAALLFPAQASDKELGTIENCLAKGVKG